MHHDSDAKLLIPAWLAQQPNRWLCSGYAHNTAASIQGALMELTSVTRALGDFVQENPSVDYVDAHFERTAKRLLLAINVSD